MTDVKLLKKELKEHGLNQGKMAELLGITDTAFSLKVHGKKNFKQAEIKTIAETLEFEPQKTWEVFFN